MHTQLQTSRRSPRRSFVSALAPRWRSASLLPAPCLAAQSLAAQSLAALSLSALSACVPDIDDDTSLVSGARVLAIAAEPPEAGEGDAVTLSALIASAGDASDAPSFSFCRARKPLSELGPVDPSCLSGSGVSLAPLGSGASVQATIDRGVCSVFGPRRPSAEPGQPAGRAADPDATGGFYQPVMAALPGQFAVLGGVRLDCGLPSADRAQVIEYNQRHRINQNPRIDRLEALRGEAWTEVAPSGDALRVGAGERLALRVAWAECPADERCTGAETYVMYDVEAQALVDRTESLLATWYATAGEFDDERSEATSAEPQALNGWTAPAEPGPVQLWVVLRDGRGGTGFGSYRLEIQ